MTHEAVLQSPAGRDPDRLSLVEGFRLIYGRPMTESEAEWLTPFRFEDEESTNLDLLRRITHAVDRQVTATPLTVRMSEGHVSYSQMEGFELAIDRADIAVSWEIRHTNAYEAHLTAFLRRALKPGMTFVDVGANIGFYSLLASGLVGPNGRVLAFEPNSENCRLLLLSVQRNGVGNVRLLPIALSVEEGCAYFTTHLGSNGGLLPNTAEILLNPNCIVVPTARLSSVMSGRVDVIKMDVEGAEGLVTRGAWDVILRDRPVVTSEYSVEMLRRVSGMSGRDFLTQFSDIGYDVLLLDREERTGSMTPLSPDRFTELEASTRIDDLAFVPRERPLSA